MRQTVSRPRDRSFEKNDFPIGAFRDDKQQSPLRRGFIEPQNRKLFLKSRPEIFSISITAGRSRADSNSIPDGELHAALSLRNQLPLSSFSGISKSTLVQVV